LTFQVKYDIIYVRVIEDNLFYLWTYYERIREAVIWQRYCSNSTTPTTKVLWVPRTVLNLSSLFSPIYPLFSFLLTTLIKCAILCLRVA